MHSLEALEREAIRIYRRYSTEVVEALGICPWAQKARRDGRVRERVMLEPVFDLRAAVEATRSMGADPQVAIGLLIFPRLVVDRVGFERLVAQLREAYGASSGQAEVELALAAFHPEASADTGSPDRLVPFLRRSPDPTVQLVRRSVLAEVRRNHGHGTGFVDPSMLDLRALLDGPARLPLHERVAQANLETVRRIGVDHVESILEDIRRDRDASYAALGVTRSAWGASASTSPAPADADASGDASALPGTAGRTGRSRRHRER